MVLFMIINLLSGVNPSVLKADEGNYYKNGEPTTDGGITISKNVTKYDSNSEEFEIELKVKGDSSVEHIQRSLDVVLVMDTSGSMNATRMNNAKNAAKAFVNKLINNTSSKKTKIGIVKFATTGEEVSGLTDKKDELINKINELSSGGGTYTQEGLKKAEEILNQSGADKKVMIVISDGEPTYAYGKYPDFNDWKKISDFPNKINPDTEIWHGTVWNWIGKGYNSKYKNYIVKLKTGKIGNGNSNYFTHTLDYWLDYFGYFITLPVETAKNIRKSNIDIYSVGIGLDKNEKAKAVMKGISSNNKYAETGEDGELLNNVLANLAEDITSNKIEKGSISDPMGQYVNYQDGSLTITGTKDGKADDGLNEIIGKLVSKYNNNVLTIDGITLGKGEELSVKYKVKLKDNWKDGEFHPANGETTLIPTPNESPMMFNVPKLRADATYVSIKFEKKWIGEVPTGVESVDFILSADSEVIENINPIKVSGTGWTTRLENLPKYKGGKEIKYTATEKPGKNYELKGDLATQVGTDGVITFTAENINTEKVNITVTKKWVKTPDEFQTDVEVELWSRVENEEFTKKATGKIVKSKAKYTFLDLNKYDSNGKLIKYLVKEKDVDENGNLKKEDHSFTVDVKQTEGNNYDWTITNTCNASTKMIEFKLVKVWDAVPDESVMPKFTIKATAGKYSSSSSITLPINEGKDYYNTVKSKDGKTWTTIIQALKYYSDMNPFSYTIEEEKLNGYESTPNGPQKIEDNGTVTFTNRELHKDKFTVHKTWKGEPAGSVKFGLYDGNSKVDELKLTDKDAQVTSQNFWSGKFKNDHPVRNLNGEVIKYEVKELDDNNKPVEKEVKLGNRTYKVESRPAENNVFIFTNTDITKGDVQIIKTWVGTEGKAKFGLFKNGDEKISNKEPNLAKTSVDGQYTVKFENVSLTDEEGKAVKYEIKELGDSDNILNTDDIVSLGGRKYKVSYDANGNITNTELIDITVTKTWGENVPQSERKSVEVGIYAGNERKITVELKDGKWEATVANLPYLPDGYTVKEVEINGIEVNNDLKKLFKVEGEMEKIKETSTINITNSFDLSENKEGKINVLKQWTVDPKNIKVKLYRKTAATTTESSKWVEVGTEELNGNTKVLKTAFDKVEGSEKYQILETAVGTDELTEVDIQNILSSKTESPIEYKIGEYEVTVHNLGNDTFFIKNTQDSTMKELVVEKKWSDNTLDKYKEAVQVQLYKVENNNLVPVGESRYLNSSNWITKFKGLRIKDAEGKNIDYRVAEVVVGNTIKTNLTLDDLQKGYKIGSSTVTIDGSDINAVVITNDVNLRDISVKKAWEGTATAGAVEITLYKKVGDKLESVETKKLNSEGKWMTDFERQPKVDEEGVEIEYRIFETAIDGVKINIDPTAASGYKTDEQGISYSTGTINDGSYSVVITGNSKDNNFVVKNSFTRNPVLPVIPGGDTPGGIPVIPVVTPDPFPTPTPNPSTPVIDVPDDSSPQGPATPVNDGDEDNGVTEIDEDDVPQGDGKEVKKDNKANKDTVDITDNKAPKGTANLPKTGGEAGNFLSIIGLGLIGLGLVIRRRR